MVENTYRICRSVRRSTARSVRTCIRACPWSSDRLLKINFAIIFEIIFSVPRAYHHSLQYLRSGRGNDLVDSSFIFFIPSSVSPIPRRLFTRPIRYDSLHRLTASLDQIGEIVESRFAACSALVSQFPVLFSFSCSQEILARRLPAADMSTNSQIIRLHFPFLSSFLILFLYDLNDSKYTTI